jgi:hypothetical protein
MATSKEEEDEERSSLRWWYVLYVQVCVYIHTDICMVAWLFRWKQCKCFFPIFHKTYRQGMLCSSLALPGEKNNLSICPPLIRKHHPIVILLSIVIAVG